MWFSMVFCDSFSAGIWWKATAPMEWRNLWMLTRLFYYPRIHSISFWSPWILFFSLANDSVMISLLSWGKLSATWVGQLPISQSKGSRSQLHLTKFSDLVKCLATQDWDMVPAGRSLAIWKVMGIMRHIHINVSKSFTKDVSQKPVTKREIILRFP